MVAFVVGEFAGLLVEDHDKLGFGQPAFSVGYTRPTFEEFRQGLSGCLRPSRHWSFVVGSLSIAAVTGEHSVGLSLDQLADCQGQFAHQLAGYVGETVGGCHQP